MPQDAVETSLPEPVSLEIQLLDDAVALPQYAHPTDAGMDLVSTGEANLAPGQRATVGTGVAIALPAGYVGLVHPRSGLAARHGLTVLNAPGTVDAGYRGEIKVTLLNTDLAHTAHIRRGDRIAQLVVQQVAHVRWQPVTQLGQTSRGSGGFGSTGGFAATTPQEDPQ